MKEQQVQITTEAEAFRELAKRVVKTKKITGLCALVEDMGDKDVIPYSLCWDMHDRIDAHMNSLPFEEKWRNGWGGEFLDVPGRRSVRVLAALMLAEEAELEAQLQ